MLDSLCSIVPKQVMQRQDQDHLWSSVAMKTAGTFSNEANGVTPIPAPTQTAISWRKTS